MSVCVALLERRVREDHGRPVPRELHPDAQQIVLAEHKADQRLKCF